MAIIFGVTYFGIVVSISDSQYIK